MFGELISTPDCDILLVQRSCGWKGVESSTKRIKFGADSVTNSAISGQRRYCSTLNTPTFQALGQKSLSFSTKYNKMLLYSSVFKETPYIF